MNRTVWIVAKRDKNGDREFLCDMDTLESSDDYSKVVYFHSEEEAQGFIDGHKKELKGFYVE